MNTHKQRRTLRYRLWLALCWVRNVLAPDLGTSLDPVVRFARYVVAVTIVAAPVTVYLITADDINGAMPPLPSVKMASNQMSGSPSASSSSKENSSVTTPAVMASADISGGSASPVKETALDHALKHTNPNYVCPMHPEIIDSDPSATCPICGMDLVELKPIGENGVVELSTAVMNSLGVRVADVKRKTLYRRIDSVGYISADENKIRTVNLRSDGWVERLVVKTDGERVKKGQLLLEVYSPKLVNAQEEYLQAKALGNTMLVKASQQRLRALGVSAKQIKRLKSKRQVEQLVKVYAAQAGIVSELNVREGMYVKPSKPLLKLIDLDSVWLLVDVFERQSDWVKVGQRAMANLPFLPDKSWEGKVEYIYPTLDPKTRTLKVRLRFDNVDEKLKPNMYSNVTIFAKPRRKVLSIPREALIRTGNEQRVIVSMGEGKFIPMKVRVGVETSSRIEILSGLTEGDKVVVSSQFLIDSESSLQASLKRMTAN